MVLSDFQGGGSGWVGKRAFLRIDVTAVFCSYALLFAARPIAEMYAGMGLPAPAMIGWLSGLPWWAAMGLAAAVTLVVIGKNYFIRSPLARLIISMLTLAAVGCGIVLLALAIFGATPQLMNQMSR